MNPDGIYNLLFSVIKDKVNKQEAFTAFDITMQAKKQGLKERHRNVKKTIHDIMYYEFNSYHTTVISIDGVDVNPILYYPNGYDVNDYVPMDRTDITFQVIPSNNVSSDENEEDDEDDEDVYIGPVDYDDYDVLDDEDDGGDLW